ncbi:phenylacetate--CoA ligase family protein [Streptomyces sp. NPDC057575]|uniref:phenylacetate--CoA ligase family protein n=1 Tax=unclassified Streptomyces TaxID=2593676 RepID=UPI0036C99DB3
MASVTDIGYRPSSFKKALAEVAFAYEQVPFFAGHLDEAGIGLADVRTADDFRRIPTTQKIDYRRNFPQGVLARGKTLRDPLTLKSQSSGTGGERLTTITHTYALAERMRATLLANKVLGEALARCRSHRPIRYAAPNCSDVECATPFTTIQDRTLPDGTLVLPVSHDVLATPDQLVQQAIDETEEFDPHWFYADATHLAFLVRQLKARGLKPPQVSAVALTYTLVTGVARRQLQEFFGADMPMAEIVSMTELGWVAIECPAGRMHVNNQTFFAEFLVDGRPAGPGERAELVATSLGDRISPHLRYRTGDIYSLGEQPCVCGSDLPQATHEGRLTTMIKVVKDGAPALISPRDVDRAVGADLPIDVYQLRQPASGEMEFRYIPSAGARVDEKALRERLLDMLGTTTSLAIESVTYIPAARTGKFASCVSEVTQPASNGGEQ